MGLFGKLFGGSTTQKQPDQLAVSLANQFVEAFNSRNLNKTNDLAEDMIEMAGRYWAKCDTESFMCLLHAAEETSFMYSGNKYPRDLVEELIRKQRN